ncbi:unnamed protein product [Sphagnum tenellum]
MLRSCCRAIVRLHATELLQRCTAVPCCGAASTLHGGSMLRSCCSTGARLHVAKLLQRCTTVPCCGAAAARLHAVKLLQRCGAAPRPEIVVVLQHGSTLQAAITRLHTATLERSFASMELHNMALQQLTLRSVRSTAFFF